MYVLVCGPQVTAQLQLPRAACALGMDHLFLSVDAAPLPTGHMHYESVTENNYMTVPITCATSGMSLDPVDVRCDVGLLPSDHFVLLLVHTCFVAQDANSIGVPH